MEIREHPPLNIKTSTMGPRGGDAESLAAPTTYVKDVNGGPPGPFGGLVSMQYLKSVL
jgi:hypothetical protein